MRRLLSGVFAIPMFLALTGIIATPRGTATAWMVPNVLLYPVLAAACIALHEAGHAVVGRALGLRVLRIDLGIGRRLASWRWRSTRFCLHAFPILGLTYLGAERVEGVRWRLWLAIAAGPLTTVAIAAAALAMLDLGVKAVLWPHAAMVNHLALGEIVAFESIWMLVLNLSPLGLFRTTYSSDGTQLVRIPVMSARKLLELTCNATLLEVDELVEAGQLDRARDAVRRDLERVPDSVPLRNALANVLLQQDQLDEARTLWLELVDATDGVIALVIRNNLAWVDFLLQRDELRAEADEYSALVHGKLKRAGFAIGTRGAVLGWLGRHDEAVALLDEAYARASTPRSRASEASALAYSLAMLGRTADAKRWLERAVANDATCRLLPRARAAIAESPLP